ncbi:Piso0_005869 [Millerozyma farinosa CBS 7064]|uniref:U3 small nucleolar RNA-associated protein 11 n=1 Tax=Pichia sorbitophila (strain ATCC MYA-4447 / BCRC 22081 / CBS 7064 / NBRC 10061 / NRRL Y-12695) TaxID=559304 RepID=G8Y351_PICSO|nr:Piso0_005869 [Millerozyma farinosa CBS 7064]
MAKLVHNVQKKQHRERSQVSERSRFGLLEKKKDYKLRAADYHKKQAAIKALKNKAANYNPDEYYHSMTKKKTDDKGVLISDRGDDALSVQQVKLLKTQDANYVRTMRLRELQKISKDKNSLDFKSEGKHTVFVDSVEGQKEFRPEAYFKTDKSLLKRRENRLPIDVLENKDNVIRNDESSKDERIKQKEQLNKLKQFKLYKGRLERESQLRQVEERMELTKELMKKGSKKKIKDSDGKVKYKWKNERKK